MLRQLGLWIGEWGIPLQIVPGPIWFFGTDTSQVEIGATEKKAGNIGATDS